MRKIPVCGPVRAESPASPEPRATPWVLCPHSLRPERAKVEINHSPILLPFQGVGVYALTPRALPWAVDWLPFQGARGDIGGQARAESPASPKPRATPWVLCPHFLRPERAKVEINHSPILLPLQGVGVCTLIPRALPWAGDWLPFQGAPFRALFVYHVRMLCHLLFGKKKRAEFFSGF